MPSSSNDGKDSQLLCFEHCDNKIFALDTPETCPGCETPLSKCQFRIPPFTLPTPFSRARDYPCSIAIKPTKGSWLEDFCPGANLHIAVTTSEGEVIEFDQNGLHSDRTDQWDKCLVINLLSGQLVDPDVVQDPDWEEYWDWTLNTTVNATESEWSAAAYDEDKHNCFALVLTFLRALRQRPFSDWAEDKVDFCRQFVLPKTRVAAKYIGLYRKLRDSEDGVLAVAMSDKQEQKKEDEMKIKNVNQSSSEDGDNDSRKQIIGNNDAQNGQVITAAAEIQNGLSAKNGSLSSSDQRIKIIETSEESEIEDF